MASKNWRDAFDKLVSNLYGPAWAKYTQLTAFFGDVASQGLAEALQAPWLFSDTSPDDALPLIGSGRNMERYVGETADQYRARLEAAWAAWQQAGNEASLTGQLAAMGCSGLEFHRPGASVWNWDGNLSYANGGGGAAFWSRFFLVINAHPWSPIPALGSGVALGSSGTCLGLTATTGQIDTVRAIVNKWKPAHVTCPWIIFVTDPTQWAADGSGPTTGDWYDWRNRSTGARYVSGPNVPAIVLTPH